MVWKLTALAALLGVLTVQATTLPRSLPLLRTLEKAEERFAQAEELEGDDRLRLLTSCLYGINARIRPFPDQEASAKLNAKVQDRLFSTPGHAEYVVRQLREPWEAALEGDMDQLNRYAMMREAKFKLLSFMPTPETVRLMVGFFDSGHLRHPGWDDIIFNPAGDAVNVLIKILEDPPLDKQAPFDVWRQWRDDVEAGKITYRLKGVGGEYNFKGPVASSSSLDRHGSRPPPGRKKVAEEESADAGTSKDGPPVTMIVIAAILLVGAVSWIIASRRAVNG